MRHWIDAVGRRIGSGRTAALAALAALALSVLSCQLPGGTPPDGTPLRAVTNQPPTAAPEPDMRIRVRAGLASALIDGPARMIVRSGAGPMHTLTAPLAASATPAGLRILDGDGKAHEYDGPLDIAGSTPEPMLRVDAAAYPGRLRLAPRQPRASLASAAPGPPPAPPTFDVIEIVPLETYLTGVVAAELIKSWPVRAFEAQAIAARTYALHERARAMRTGRDYDLESTTADQAYDGATKLPAAVQGVAATRGIVLTWQGRLLRTYYSSTCGGRYSGAAEVWPTGPGFEYNLDAPIQAHPRPFACEQSPAFRWEVTRQRDHLGKQVREWGRANGSGIASISDIAAAAPIRFNQTGRPTRYRLVDASGASFEIGAEQLRLACNHSPAQGVPAVTRETRVRSGDLEMDFSRPGMVIIRGRGFGHGVGMCQWCLKGMADRGDSWREMLPRFYPGAAIERAY